MHIFPLTWGVGQDGVLLYACRSYSGEGSCFCLSSPLLSSPVPACLPQYGDTYTHTHIPLSTTALFTTRQLAPTCRCRGLHPPPAPPLDPRSPFSIHYSFCQGRTAAVEALLQVGADLTAVAARGTTALHAASYYGHLESVVIM